MDLCAAPGGWLQVASEYMPVSSVIVGVDLVPIAPIRNVITFQSDITTKACYKELEGRLGGWAADVVLHDGAPNVGKNWLHDAYGQNLLVVSALKLACSMLNKGGWFVTKIFRSSDYNSLLWVFGKLFGKVHATKPQASRQESAEIFVVCQNYRKPQDLDPRFFDPSALFADISNFDEDLKKKKADLLKPLSKIKKSKAHGYDDGDIAKTISDVEFVTSNSHMDYLAQCNEIKITNTDILKHEATDDEIKECCKDLRILGRRDLLRLLKWRRDVRKDLISKLMQALVKSNDGEEKLDGSEGTNLDHLTIDSDDSDVESAPELQLDDIEQQEETEKNKELKRLKRKEERKRKDYQQRVSYGMVNHGDVLIEEEHDLFSLKKINGMNQLKSIDEVEPELLVNEPTEEEEEATSGEISKQQKSVRFSREADVSYFEVDKDYDDDDQEMHPSDDIVPTKIPEDKIVTPVDNGKAKQSASILKRLSKANNAGGGLLTDLMDVNNSKAAAASKFFDADDFDIDLEREYEMDIVDKIAKAKTVSFMDEDEDDAVTQSITTEDQLDRFDDDSAMLDDDSDKSSDSDEEESKPNKRPMKLDPEGLAMAAMMVGSDKVRKEIEDEGWNRYSHADTHMAPKWFRDDEEKHCRRNIPVSQELVKEYKQKLREIDSKPIKKVLQAKARQKRRAMRKMERLKKKVDAITTNEDLTQRERVSQIKQVYKNATKSQKKEVQLVVARKGVPLKKPTKGKYKTVDSRMKKDLRAKKRQEAKRGGKSKKGKSFNPKRSKHSGSRPSTGHSKIKSKKATKSRKR